MRRQDAQDILRMIESLWAYDLGAATRDAWRPIIEEMPDARLVTEAVLGLGKREVYKPSLALIREAVHKLEQDRGLTAHAPPKEIPWVRSEIPLWIKRWFYARFRKVPPDMRPFREQEHDIEGTVDEWMPADEYVAEASSVRAEDVEGAFRAGRQM